MERKLSANWSAGEAQIIPKLEPQRTIHPKEPETDCRLLPKPKNHATIQKRPKIHWIVMLIVHRGYFAKCSIMNDGIPNAKCSHNQVST